jgi:4-amino-4-deoxy-L-arabinose transferase-like glycosyltransferase
MLGKATGGREAHGAPPGTYLAAFFVTAWPLAPFAMLAARPAWQRRAEPAVTVLLAWLVPTWLLFEALPTKLPHYVLPVYPAIAILAAMALDRTDAALDRPRWAKAAILILAALLPAGLAAALAAGRNVLWSALPAPTLALGLLAVLVAGGCALWSARRLLEGDFARAVPAAVLAALTMNAFVLGALLTPRVSNLLAVSNDVAAAGRAAMPPGCGPGTFASVGDHEPSLVFLTGTDLLLAKADEAARFVKAADCRAAFVERRDEPAFQAALGRDSDVGVASRVQGTAINGGKHLDIAIYVRQRTRP